MSPGVAFAAGAAGNLIGVAASLYGGSLSDRIGRRPVMIAPAVATLVLLLPIFYWITEARTAVALIGGSMMLGLLGSIGGGAFYTAITESLPKRIRGGAFATTYAVSIAVFGGTTQPIITWLIQVTGSPMAPAWYLFCAAAIGLVARWLIAESAPAKLPGFAPAE
jgi:MFS family permease